MSTNNKIMSATDHQVDGDHYNTPIQHHEFCRANNIPWHESCAMKYIMRHKKKNGLRDIAKAVHYLLMMTELEYSEEEQLELKQELVEMLGLPIKF